MRSHRVSLGHARAGSSRAWIYARAHSARGTPRLEGLEHTRLEHCRLVSHTSKTPRGLTLHPKGSRVVEEVVVLVLVVVLGTAEEEARW